MLSNRRGEAHGPLGVSIDKPGANGSLIYPALSRNNSSDHIVIELGLSSEPRGDELEDHAATSVCKMFGTQVEQIRWLAEPGSDGREQRALGCKVGQHRFDIGGRDGPNNRLELFANDVGELLDER